MRPTMVARLPTALFAILLLSSMNFAVDSWTDDGHGGVYWTMNNYTISAYPKTSNELINHYQYVNFTSTNPANILTNLSFVFDQQPLSGDVLLWQNLSHQVQVPHATRLNSTYQINNVTVYVTSSSQCQIGDAQNTLKYSITYGNNSTTTIACFDSFINVSNNYTLTYSYNGTAYTTQTQYWNDWGSILNLFIYTNTANHHVYTINNVPFNGNTNYQTKFLYSFPVSSGGKFDIYAHSGSPSDVVNGIGTTYVVLDPWWNSTWDYAMAIDINTTIATNLTNFPAKVNINTTNLILWNTTTCTNVRFITADNLTVLNYDLDSANTTFCGNSTNNATFWVSGNYTGNALTRIYAYLGNTGAASGENVAATWADYISVYHGDSFKDELGRHNMSEANGTVTIISDPLRCKTGFCFNFDSGYLNGTCTGALPTVNNPHTFSAWAYRYNDTDHAYIAGFGSSTQYIGYGRDLSRMGLINNRFNLSVYGGTYGSNPAVVLFDKTPVNIPKYYAAKYNGTTMFASNGTNFNTTTSNWDVGTCDFNSIGGAYEDYPSFWRRHSTNNTIDEYRLTNVSRSNDWITAEYAQTAIIGTQPFTIQMPTLTIVSPFNTSYINNLNVSHIFDVNYTNSSNITVKFYLDGGLNQTTTQTANTTYNLTKTMANGLHSWYVFAYLTSNQSINITSLNYTYTVDTEIPNNLNFTSPLNGTQYRYNNISFLLNFNESNIKNCTLFSSIGNFTMTILNTTTCSYNIVNNTSISMSFYGQVCDQVDVCNVSENYTISPFFNVSIIQPLNGSSLTGASANFSYSTTNIFPLQCDLYINNVKVNNQTVNSSNNVSSIESILAGSNSWFVSCQSTLNSSLIYNTTPVSFTTSISNMTNYYVISLVSENIFTTPQALFYDLNGNLNIFYYNLNGGVETAQLKTLTNGLVTKSYSLVNSRTNNFISVMRLSNTTLILTFNQSNSSANFLQYNNSSLTVASEATSYNAQSNSYYDPYNYAYTKQFTSLNIGNGSYYLFIIQNGTSTNLVRMNAIMNASNTINLSIAATYAPPFTWQTIANNNNLTSWYYAAPKGGAPYTITIYSYNGTGSTEIATPDATTYNAGNITASKVFFEEYSNNTYFMQSNITNPLIYLIGTTKNTTLNGTITNPSQFYFVDKWTFVFFSTEGTTTYAYSCYFETGANCTKVSAADYGSTVPYARGVLTTSKRITNILTGPQDVVTNGFITNTINSTILYYNEYNYDLKMKCQDESNLTRDLMNVRIFSTSTSIIMNPGTYIYGYVTSNSLLGNGTRQVYSFCPAGTNRMYIYNPLVNPSLDTFSLINVAPNAYYTFLLTDCYGQPSRGALVTAKRFMTDRQDFAIVEQAYSSISGDAVLFLQPFVTYKLSVLATDGYNISIDFIPATTASIPVSLQCAGQAINVTPTYEQIYNNLSYRIMARNLPPSNLIVTGASTNQSFNISFNSSSPQGRIYWSNFMVYRSVGDGTRTLIYNITDSTVTGAYREIFINSSTGAAYYEMVMNLNVLRLDLNNSAGTYDLANSTQRVLVTSFTNVQLTAYDSTVSKIRINLTGAFGGWAWVFIVTILTMLVVGYVSRFTLDGAGIIGSMFFIGMAIINPVSVAFAGIMFPMLAIGGIGFIVALLLIIWRYV
jgi:hypothetical protein